MIELLTRIVGVILLITAVVILCIKGYAIVVALLAFKGVKEYKKYV